MLPPSTSQDALVEAIERASALGVPLLLESGTHFDRPGRLERIPSGRTVSSSGPWIHRATLRRRSSPGGTSRPILDPDDTGTVQLVDGDPATWFVLRPRADLGKRPARVLTCAAGADAGAAILVMQSAVAQDGPMQIFLSYRRDDAAGHAGRLRDDLLDRLGPGSVFQDVASIAPGRRYRTEIEEAIAAADLVLVVIGRRWATVGDERGRTRLDAPEDIVRREVETALRVGRQVVPVLVDGAGLPRADALPATLAPLLELNGMELRDEAWTPDLDRMCTALGIADRRARRLSRRQVLAPVALLAVVLAGVSAFLLGWLGGGRPGNGPTDPGGTATAEPSIAAPSQRPEPLPAVGSTTSIRKGHRGQVRWLLVRWWRTPAGAAGRSVVTLEMKVTNDTDESMNVYEDLFHLRAGGIDQGPPRVGVVEGHEAPGTGEANIVRLRYGSVPAGEPLVLLLGESSEGRIDVTR